MGLAASTSTSKSEQEAQTYITQQFAGTCEITCNNSASNVSIDVINDVVGGDVGITQTCSTNGACIIGNTSDTVTDVYFAAANSSNSGIAFPFQWNKSISEGRQNIKQSVREKTKEGCNMSTYNQVDNISILAANSTIGGSVGITQEGSPSGQCQLNNSMSAAAKASGQVENTSTSGKDKAGSFGMIYWIVFVVVVISIAGFAAKFMSSKSSSKATPSRYSTTGLAQNTLPLLASSYGRGTGYGAITPPSRAPRVISPPQPYRM